ncbi:MAG: ankyrin repeat domain-containing protein, partial [Pseudomonadales bacterium]|nr:ankyrin repeat domain-containing protein [Pseudomonadales bacterium]
YVFINGVGLMEMKSPTSDWLDRKEEKSKKQLRILLALFIVIMSIMTVYRFSYDPILYWRYESAIKENKVDSLRATRLVRAFSENEKRALLSQAISINNEKTLYDLLNSGKVSQEDGFESFLLNAFSKEKYHAVSAILQRIFDSKKWYGNDNGELPAFYELIYAEYKNGISSEGEYSDINREGFLAYIRHVCTLDSCVDDIFEYVVDSENMDAISLLIQSGFDVNQRLFTDEPKIRVVEHGLKYQNPTQIVRYDFGHPVYATPRITWSETESRKDVWDTPLLHVITHHLTYVPDPILLRHTELNNNSVPTSSEDMIRLLVEKGADVNLVGKDGRTPVMLAARLGYLDLLPYFLEKGADFSIEDNEGRNLLHYVYACSDISGDDKAMHWVRWLAGKGIMPVEKDLFGLSIQDFGYILTEFEAR